MSTSSLALRATVGDPDTPGRAARAPRTENAAAAHRPCYSQMDALR